MTKIFMGNCPGNVSQDAKYSVVRENRKSVVRLIYRTNIGEQWCITTEEHPELTEMVLAVKPDYGSFYINEYNQVIVPVAEPDGGYLYAGAYSNPLRFAFENVVISGEPIDAQGIQLQPGVLWLGPHAGIPYVLAAGGSDIYYVAELRPKVTKKIKLSEKIGAQKAKEVAAPIMKYKGSEGGRFYVNEHQVVFAPVQENDTTKFKYIGTLDLSKWFPKQQVV